MIIMEELRSWLIGLSIVGILSLGIAPWLGNTAELTTAEGGAIAEVGADEQTASEGWGTLAPNFAPGEPESEHAGGDSARWGTLTVGDICEAEGVDTVLAQSRLSTYGLEAAPDVRIRELADTSDYKPSEIVDVILGNDPGAECDDPDCDCDHDAESENDGEVLRGDSVPCTEGDL